jgi:hypothetical protein
MDQTTRPWHRTLYLAALAALIVLVAAASAWATSSGSGDPSSAPSQFQPVQDDESAPPDRPDGHDCPDGDRGGDDGDGDAAPQPSPGTTPDATATPDV